jgi:hypothetical protein
MLLALPTSGRPGVLLCRRLATVHKAPIPPYWEKGLFLRGRHPCQGYACFWRGLDRDAALAHNVFVGEWERCSCQAVGFQNPLPQPGELFLSGIPSMPLDPLLSALGASQTWLAARWGSSFWWGAAISAAVSVGPGSGPQSAPYRRLCIHGATRRCFRSSPQINLFLFRYSIAAYAATLLSGDSL